MIVLLRAKKDSFASSLRLVALPPQLRVSLDPEQLAQLQGARHSCNLDIVVRPARLVEHVAHAVEEWWWPGRVVVAGSNRCRESRVVDPEAAHVRRHLIDHDGEGRRSRSERGDDMGHDCRCWRIFRELRP